MVVQHHFVFPFSTLNEIEYGVESIQEKDNIIVIREDSYTS